MGDLSNGRRPLNMRLFYKSDDIVIEFIKSADGKSSTQVKGTLSDAQSLVDSGDAIIYDTIDKLNEAVAYAESRREAYPDMADQLDKMYHDGFDAWKETIKAVKDAHPKP